MILPLLLFACVFLAIEPITSRGQSLRPYVIPKVGDFLTYNNTAVKPDGSLNYTNVVWNLTFSSNPSQDLFAVTFQSFYPGALYPPSSNPPVNGSYWLVNVANMIVNYTYNFPLISSNDLPMSFPFLLPTNMSLGSHFQVTSQNPPSFQLNVVAEQNVTLDGVTYECWNASGQDTGTEITNVLFAKTSGIVLYFDKHSSLNFESNVFQILLGRVGDYPIVGEYSPIMFSVLSGISVAAIFLKRRMKKKELASPVELP